MNKAIMAWSTVKFHHNKDLQIYRDQDGCSFCQGQFLIKADDCTRKDAPKMGNYSGVKERTQCLGASFLAV
jgi:hypothetical protein